MPVVDTDIVVNGSANMQETNTGVQGGARDATVLMIFNDIIAASDTLDVFSDNAGDTTQTLTITGRLLNGTIDTEVYTLTGTTPVVGTKTFERVLKGVLSGTTAGSITVEEATSNADLIVIPGGTVTSFRRPFYDVAAEAAGGVARDYYEKIFFYNSNATSALTAATIAEIAGGAAANIDFMLPATLDDSGTSPDRVTAPAGTFDSTTKNVANAQSHTNLTAQGVWIHLSLPAGTAASNSTYQLRESGQTV